MTYIACTLGRKPKCGGCASGTTESKSSCHWPMQKACRNLVILMQKRPFRLSQTITHDEQNSEGKTFNAEDFSKISLNDRLFSNCSFHGCNLSKTLFQKTKVCSCTFVGCNLSLVALDGCRIQDVRFLNCKIVGAEFFKCEKLFFSANFENCLLQYCNFSDLRMKNANFSRSKIKECYFSNTSLDGANFSGAELPGTIFLNCDLCKADFSSATQYSIDPGANKIKKAKFSLPEAVGLLHGLDIIIV